MADQAAVASACRSPAFLREQINSILKFYAPVVRDPRGGFHNQLLDDGANQAQASSRSGFSHSFLRS